MIVKMLGFCLFLVFSSAPSIAAGGAGTITGKWITREYGPMTGGQVLLFNKANGPAPASEKYLRLPDQGTAIDPTGTFSVKLPAGKYYLVMRKRVDPSSAGPPQEGDPQFYARHKDGSPREYVVKEGKTTNVGTITKAAPYRKDKAVRTDDITGIEGTVTDNSGTPVAGIRVFAYESSEMKGMPRYASGETGQDGKYVLTLSHKGSYYLKARTHYGGGKPEEREFIGTYGPSETPYPVVIEKGKINNKIDIVVTRFTQQQQKAGNSAELPATKLNGN